MSDLQKAKTGEIALALNLWDKYLDRLRLYEDRRKEVEAFIRTQLKRGRDYGKTYDDPKGKARDTLMKPGAEKILGLMECSIKLYADPEVHEQLGKPRAVCLVGYVVDRSLLVDILKYLTIVGMDREREVVRLFAWGEGRGAYELAEKCYSGSEKPLAGSVNRAVKLAEKRCGIDAVIRTFGLDFTQDEEYESSGRLRGDDREARRPPQARPMSGEDAQVYAAIMALLNEQGAGDRKGVPLLAPEVREDFKRRADAARQETAALRAVYQAVKARVDAARMGPQSGGGGEPNGEDAG